MIERIPIVFFVGLGGILGAVTRYYTGEYFSGKEIIGKITAGTLVVNIFGSVILSILITLHQYGLIGNEYLIFIGTGFMGSLTTMSTFTAETIALTDESYVTAFIYLCIMLLLVFTFAILARIMMISYLNYLDIPKSVS